ncbi:MAG: mitochondrial fission ELM1 family protein [Hyphomicrobiales bacterium]|nr:mitochondrial fission ELM1 family protein [Hyphomicrobiales bacterium]
MHIDSAREGKKGACSPPEPGSRTPTLWLILGDKLGDNRQVDIIADELGWPVTVKRLRFLDRYAVKKPTFQPSLHHVDLEQSSPLNPPWPELVITVGRRPSMAALWVYEQSGGRTKLVIVGRPIRRMNDFALVVASPQYRLPKRPNVIHLAFPLIRADQAAISAAVEIWRSRLEVLPRPITGVFVGGPTRPFVFSPESARDFIQRLNTTAGASGTLFVSTSRRTPADVVETLAAHLPASAQLFKWELNASDNPYLALLGLADRFVVTGDSTSMIVEVARLGKPLAIYPLPLTRSPWSRVRGWLAAQIQPGAGATDHPSLLNRFGDVLYNLGLISYSRDLSALHQRLIEQGRAVLLGADFPAGKTEPLPDGLPEVARRIRALFRRLNSDPPV